MSTAIDLGLTDEQRTEVVQGLACVLADSYTLYLKTHSYHWNVVGPMFASLHAMFEAQYTELALAVDEIAERIRALGAPAPGTYREFAALSAVVEDDDRPAATEMVARLVAAHETTGRTIRAALAVTEGAADPVSTDLLVRRLDVHQKTAWMLRSVLG